MKIKVLDTGIGINEENQKDLFQIFSKAKSSNHLNKAGVGLGLTICKRICECMGGWVKMSS